MKYIAIIIAALVVGCGQPLTPKEVVEQSRICFDRGMVPEMESPAFASYVYAVQCEQKEPVCVEYKTP